MPVDQVHGLPEVQEVLRKVMATVIVTRCELLYHADAYEYVALSHAFTPVPVNIEPPMYDVSYDEDTGKVSWTMLGGGDAS